MTENDREDVSRQMAVAVDSPGAGKGDSKGTAFALVCAAIFVIIVAGLLAYSNTFSGPFHLEDQRQIRDNTALHELRTFPEALEIANRSAGPGAMLTFALNWALAPGDASVFHVVNALLHALNGVLVFLVCRRLMTKRTAELVPMVSGLLFVVHPVTTQTVNYLVGRGMILAVGFTLVSVLLFLHATRREGGFGVWALGASILAFVAASTCHGAALALPFLVLLAACVDRRDRGLVQGLGVHALYWGVFGVLVALKIRGAGNDAGWSAWARPSAASHLAAVAAFLRLLMSPVGLTVAHPFPVASGLGFWAGISGMLILVLVTLGLLWRRSAFGFALGWCVVGVAAGGVGFCVRGVVDEQWLYLPVVGIALVVPLLIAEGPSDKRLRVAVGIAAALIVATAGVFTFSRNHVWQSELSLWSDAAEKTPDAVRPHRVLGKLHRLAGEEALSAGAKSAEEKHEAGAARFRELAQRHFLMAEDHLLDVVEEDPNDAESVISLGLVIHHLNRPWEALITLLKGLRLDPDNQDCTIRVADALFTRSMSVGDREEVIRCTDYYRRAARLGPLPPAVLARYGTALATLGNPKRAEEVLLQAELPADDSWPGGILLKQVQESLSAVKELETQAATLRAQDPGNPAGPLLAARALAAEGRDLEARYLLSSMLGRFPNDPATWQLLGFIAARTEAAAQFAQEWGALGPVITQDAQERWLVLAKTCALSDYWDAAQTYLESPGARASGVAMPLMYLAQLATEMGQHERAGEYLKMATQAYPSSSAPWLRLCDAALEAENYALAGTLLDEAEKRGADPGQVKPRRGRISSALGSSQVQTLMPIVR